MLFLKKIVGQQLNIDDLTLDMFAIWGKSLGKLHAAAQSYTGVGRPTWQQHLTECTQNIPASELAAHRVITNVRTQLNALPQTPDTFGLIHFDFELDNLLWTPQGITSIDFDDSAWYWFSADIAFALRDLFDDNFRRVDTNSQPFRVFMEGYRAERDISAAEIAQLPLFLMLHHVLSFAKILRALKPTPSLDGPSLEEPQWAETLRQKLESIARAYRSEFIHYTR